MTDPASLPDPPGPRGALSAVGRWRAFRTDPLGTLTRLHREHGDVAGFRLGPRRLALVADPERIGEVLAARQRDFIKSLALQRSRVLLGEGLLTSEDPLHLRQRRMIQPAFHRDRVAALVDDMAAVAEETVDGWRAGETLDAAREMNRLALRIAGRTLFGAELEGRAETIAEALGVALGMFGRLTHPLGPLLNRLPIPSTRRMERARDRLDETVYAMIGARRAAGGGGDDLLALLLAARDDEGDGAGMDDRLLRDEALTLFLAGHETTANALAWSWWLLGRHPEAEARLHGEVDAVLGGRRVSAADVPRLPWARAVVAEAMRLYPPAWAIGREPVRDVALDGVRLRAGSIVILAPWVTHRDPRWWPEPERFLPDRWLEDAADRPRFAYFPFGGGPRKCIGEGFAWSEAVVVLAAVARRWRLRPVPGAPPPVPEPRLTLRPGGGIAVRVEPR